MLCVEAVIEQKGERGCEQEFGLGEWGESLGKHDKGVGSRACSIFLSFFLAVFLGFLGAS